MKKQALTFDKNLFEKVLIYNCIIDQSYLEAIIDHTKPSYFANERIKNLFDSINSYYKEFKKVPNITELKLFITDENKRKELKEIIMSFQNIDKSYDRDILLQNTERFLKEKAVYQTVVQTSVEMQSGEIDTNKILKSFESACSISLCDTLGFDYLESIEQHCQDLQKVFKTIPTGWKWLDEMLGGGFQAEGKSMVLFFGQTNVGKSIFLGNIAANVLSQNKTVLLDTLEMPESVYAKRISAQLTNIPFGDLAQNIEPLK